MLAEIRLDLAGDRRQLVRRGVAADQLRLSFGQSGEPLPQGALAIEQRPVNIAADVGSRFREQIEEAPGAGAFAGLQCLRLRIR